MGTPPKGAGRHTRFDSSAGTVEQPDEMIYIVRDGGGEIMDVGIEEFVELERRTGKSFKLTLTGKDPDKPLVLLIEADTRITVRPLGKRTASAVLGGSE